MFRRRDNETQDPNAPVDETGISRPVQQQAQPSNPIPSSPLSASGYPQPTAASSLAASVAVPTRSSALPNRAPDSRLQNLMGNRSPLEQEKSNKRLLTVGEGISLEGGKISNCDRLVVDGKVVATLSGVEEMLISENGVFEGNATIENAQISGLFEGELTVKNRLIICTNGRVKGKISYGEIEIERGGVLSGEIVLTDEQKAAASKKKTTSSEDSNAPKQHTLAA
ncbi:MAG: polymer-forming cytoskeletal protein [Alphaproteobacteria bacterium]|nr:polymer-forming cytoskeletal protein [Alphaproteobacteria bacterium]